MWTILKTLLNLPQYCFCFTFWFFGCEAWGILASGPNQGSPSPSSSVQNPWWGSCCHSLFPAEGTQVTGKQNSWGTHSVPQTLVACTFPHFPNVPGMTDKRVWILAATCDKMCSSSEWAWHQAPQEGPSEAMFPMLFCTKHRPFQEPASVLNSSQEMRWDPVR